MSTSMSAGKNVPHNNSKDSFSALGGGRKDVSDISEAASESSSQEAEEMDGGTDESVEESM